MFIGEINSIESKKVLNELFVNIQIEGNSVKFKVDTGAQCNVLPQEKINQLRKNTYITSTPVKLTAYGGGNIPVKGRCEMEIKYKEHKIKAEFYVVDTPNVKPILGLSTLLKLNLISLNNLHEIKENKDILDCYSDVFNGLGLVNGEYHIELKDNATPTVHAPRKIPLSLLPMLKTTLDDLGKQSRKTYRLG